MPRLNEGCRNRAIGRLEAGESQSSAARHFNVRQSTIPRLWQRYKLHNSTRDRPRTGRPRVTTPAQKRFIRVLHLRNRTISAANTANNVPGLRRVSAQIIRNRLRQHGIRPMRPFTAASPSSCTSAMKQNRSTMDPCTGGGSGLVMSGGSCCIYRRRNEHYTRHCIRR
ncbi:uncharacterized protein LOC124255935 [Haliotis rubra]|uniref:uncharacterized protein LOC124255935 n=1 Tax=Haliotis rubra TaxID=36100 RepID=UPI001EE62625|nr:uncharacterized protein LOC124255935 [Haliotis rubra]